MAFAYKKIAEASSRRAVDAAGHHTDIGDPTAFLSTAPAGQRDRRLAVAVIIASILVFAAAAPLAKTPLWPIPGFIPLYEGALIVTDFVTAVLLFGQFGILRSRALLVLASGYLFAALVTIAHALTFPGLFSTTGLLGAGSQSTAWLYLFWHGGFPLTVIFYAAFKRKDARLHIALPSAVLAVIATVFFLTLLATAGERVLPAIMDGSRMAPAMTGAISVVCVLVLTALAVLWAQRPHTVLDLWLMVVMCAWLCDTALSAVLNAGRFDLGFYAGRVYGLLAASFVLAVMLVHTVQLYGRLAVSAETARSLNQRIFETSADLILIVDRKGTFVQVSPSVEAILGYRPEALIGRNAAEFLYPDDLEHTRVQMRTARRTGITRSFECRYVCKDGRIAALAWTGAWSEAEQQHLFTGRDMTERIAAEAQLRQEVTERRRAEAQLRLFIEAAPAAIAMFDRDMRYLAVSQRFREDYRLGDQPLVGRSHYELFPEVPDRWREIHRRCLAGATERCEEEAFPRADGETDWLRWEIRPWHSEGDAVGGIVLFSEAITARKLAELALRDSETMLRHSQKMDAIGQLTGGLAHDFNNLLLVIMGNLGLLRELRRGDREASELAREAHEAAQRGADLTRSLLAFARRQPLEPKRADVNELVSEITALLRRTLGEQIEIALDLSPDVWPVIVDRVQLEAAVANLATNARDAMPKGGRLTIATRNRQLDQDYASEHREVTPGDYAMLEVTDTGTGMSPDILTKVFEPFFTTKGLGEGTGLGLSMVFGFMKQSGGHISVYSEIGIGTTFRLYLPCDHGGIKPVDNATATPAPRGSGERVLVVEDNVALRRLVLRQLDQLGYQVEEAENAAQALRLLDERGAVDLVFTDIIMAGKVDGFELARIVLERWPQVKIVMTSGFPNTEANGHGVPVPNVRMLSKPYLKGDLARTFREVLDGHGDAS